MADMSASSADRCARGTSSRFEVVIGTHDFEVVGYSLVDSVGATRQVSSSTFHVGGHDWLVLFFPDGRSVDCAGYSSAFLYYHGRHKKVKARFRLSLLDKDGKVSSLADFASKTRYFSPSHSRGYYYFVKKSKLRSSPCLNNDCLTIRCVVTVVKGPRWEEVPPAKKSSPISVPRPNLHEHLERMLNDPRGSDVEFSVGGELFHAHRCVLATRSPVFNAELFGAMKEKEMACIEIVDMEPAIFKALLRFVYTDSLPDVDGEGCDIVTVQHLLVAADRYGLDRLRLMCEEKLYESLDVKNVTTILALAEQHHCSQLRDACVAFIASPSTLDPTLATNWFMYIMAGCYLVMKKILDTVSQIWRQQSGREEVETVFRRV